MCVMCRFTEELVGRVRKEIREKLSARHVPHVILEIADIPVRTIQLKPLCSYS